MKCQSCGKKTEINWGRSDLVLCESCFISQGDNLLLNGGEAADGTGRDSPARDVGALAAPAATKARTAPCAFFPVASTKLAVMYIVTFGLYGVYWFYSNWRLQQPYLNKKINQALRAIFYVFFTHSLFRNIKRAAERKGIATDWPADMWATVFVVVTIASNFMDRASSELAGMAYLNIIGLALVFVLVLPLCKAQELVNMINDDPGGALNRSFTVYNYIFIALGGLVWVMAVMGILALARNA
ncbi:MAG: hypothetical protein P8079_05055 [Gammaproteobacteria bacterium]